MVTRRDSLLLAFQDFFSFYIFRRTISPFWLFRQQYLFRYRNFHHFLALWWARNNCDFLLCLHGFCFVYIQHSCRLRWPEGLYLKLYFSQAFKFAELKLQVQLKESQFFHIVYHTLNLRPTKIDFLRLKLDVISTAKTAHNQGANNESPKLYYKSYLRDIFMQS